MSHYYACVDANGIVAAKATSGREAMALAAMCGWRAIAAPHLDAVVGTVPRAVEPLAMFLVERASSLGGSWTYVAMRAATCAEQAAAIARRELGLRGYVRVRISVSPTEQR